MGAQVSADQEIFYSFPAYCNNPISESDVFRNPKNNGNFVNTYESFSTMNQILENSRKKFGKNRCLGSRDADGIYRFKNYDECYQLALKIGTFIESNHLYSELQEKRGGRNLKLIGIFSRNSEEWLLIDLACILFGFTSVPFYETLGQDALLSILNQTSLTTIFCSSQSLNLIMSLPLIKTVNTLVCMDSELKIEINPQKFNILYLHETLKQTNEIPSDFHSKVTPDTIYTISYTSGVDTDPKGVLLSHRNMVSTLTNLTFSDIKFIENDLHLSYLPLAHVYERIVVNLCIANGAGIGFYNGEVMKLRMDLSDLKPSFFTSVPRLYNKFAELIQNQEKNINFFNAFFVNRKLRSLFGGNIRFFLTASAPISPKILNYLREKCQCPFLEAYGLTESTGLSFITHMCDKTVGHVGGPCYNIEFKLVDVPEMGYLTRFSVDEVQEDESPLNTEPREEFKENNNIQFLRKSSSNYGVINNPQTAMFPKGEIYLRGPSICEGYLNDESSNKELFDEEGWLRTGDIGMINLNNGSLTIIDRKKHIFKLAQGEYVAPQKIEKIYLKCTCIDEIFVYGDSYQAFLVAIVKLNKNWCENIAKLMRLDGDYISVIKNSEINNIVLNLMDKEAQEAKLTGFEKVKKIYIISDSFMDRGVQSTTYKLRRYVAKKKFEKEIKELYQNN